MTAETSTKAVLTFSESISYFGYVICPGKLDITESSTGAILEVQDAKTQMEIRSFLGLKYSHGLSLNSRVWLHCSTRSFERTNQSRSRR